MGSVVEVAGFWLGSLVVHLDTIVPNSALVLNLVAAGSLLAGNCFGWHVASGVLYVASKGMVH